MFSVGAVFGKSIEIFSKNFLAILALALILSLPIPIYSLLLTSATDISDLMRKSFILVAITLVVNQFVTAAIIYGVVQELRGRRVSAGDALQRGIQLFFPMIGVALLVGLIIVIGMIALVIPGLIAITVLWVAIPAAVVERPGVTESLRRSSALTRGHRWGIFGLILIMGVIGGLSGYLLQKIVSPTPFAGGSMQTFYILDYVRSSIVTAFQAVLVAVGYYYLRVEKEGVDIEKIAEAFD